MLSLVNTEMSSCPVKIFKMSRHYFLGDSNYKLQNFKLQIQITRLLVCHENLCPTCARTFRQI